MLVGEENQGWQLITTQLNHERVMLGPAGRLEGLRDRVAAWAEAHGVLDEPDVRRTLGEVTASFRVNELLNWEVAPGRRAGRDQRRRRVVVEGVRLRPRAVPRPGAGRRRPPVRRPRRRGDRRPGLLPGRPGQAEPGADVRRRRERGAARADRACSAWTCRGCRDDATTPTTGSGRGRADQGHRRDRAAARARPDQPADDQQLGRGDRRRQPALPRRRGAAGDGAGVDDGRAQPAPATRTTRCTR